MRQPETAKMHHYLTLVTNNHVPSYILNGAGARGCNMLLDLQDPPSGQCYSCRANLIIWYYTEEGEKGEKGLCHVTCSYNTYTSTYSAKAHWHRPLWARWRIRTLDPSPFIPFPYHWQFNINKSSHTCHPSFPTIHVSSITSTIHPSSLILPIRSIYVFVNYRYINVLGKIH